MHLIRSLHIFLFSLKKCTTINHLLMRKNYLSFLKSICLCIMVILSAFSLKADSPGGITPNLKIHTNHHAHLLDTETGDLTISHKFLPEIYENNGDIASLQWLQNFDFFTFDVYFSLSGCGYNHATDGYFLDVEGTTAEDAVSISESIVYYQGEIKTKYQVVISDPFAFFSYQRSFYINNGNAIGGPTVIIEAVPSTYFLASSPCDHEVIEANCCEINNHVSNSTYRKVNSSSVDQLNTISNSKNLCHQNIYFPACGDDPCINLPADIPCEWTNNGGLPPMTNSQNIKETEQNSHNSGSPISNENKPRGGKDKRRVNMEWIEMEVNPNPTQNQFTLQIGEDALWDGEITITNIAGQTLKTITLDIAVEEAYVNVADLPSGLYIVQWNSGSLIGTKKLTIIK